MKSGFLPITSLCFLHKLVSVDNLIRDCTSGGEGRNDQLIWNYTPNGCYTVSSSCRVVLESTLLDEPSIVSAEHAKVMAIEAIQHIWGSFDAGIELPKGDFSVAPYGA